MSRSETAPCLSGIVVTTTAARLSDVEDALAALPGIEVHHVDAAAARLIVVQEAASIDAEIDGMRRIQALPGVVDASLVVHWFDDADAVMPALPNRSATPEILP